MSVVLRFAPSPTGRLHVGNIKIALLNWLFARKHNGRFILRMDDTDLERSTKEFEQGIIEDMTWLGLNFDALEHQSARLHHYEAAIETLKKAGRLYACYETAAELDIKRKRQLARGMPPIYDRAALNLTPEEIAKLDRKPHWRFLLQPKKITWQDMIHGQIEIDGDKQSDPVLLREDGSPVYTLSSVVDDVEMGITHIIRGEDHIANTAAQIQLIEALGADPAKLMFGHMPHVMNETGGGLSKRYGDYSILNDRERGIEPMAIISMLARLGTSDPIVPFATMEEVIAQFNIKQIGRNAPKFSAQELTRLNSKLLHDMPYAMVKDRLAAEGVDARLWDIVKKNISLFSEALEYKEICYGEWQPVIEDPEYMATALELLPAEPWDGNTWQLWTTSLKEATSRKGKELFMPLRKALTGMEHGPEMAALLPIIGREKSVKRLQGLRA